MSQFLNTINDDQAQQLIGGWGSYRPQKPSKPSISTYQSVFAPIKSSASSGASATSVNVGFKNLFSPQMAESTALSEANSIVTGGVVAA